MKRMLYIATLIISIGAFGFAISNFISPVPTEEINSIIEIDMIYMVDVANQKELIGFSDYVFIGKITKNVKTDFEESRVFPITYYNVEVIEVLMGEGLESNVTIKNIGGVDLERNLVISKGDFLPSEDQYYIFIVRISDDGNLVMDNVYQKIPLENYKSNATLYVEQIDQVKIDILNQIEFIPTEE